MMSSPSPYSPPKPIPALTTQHQDPGGLAGKLAGAADLAFEARQRGIDVGIDLGAGRRLAARRCGDHCQYCHQDQGERSERRHMSDLTRSGREESNATERALRFKDAEG